MTIGGWICDLGRMAYREAFDLQHAVQEKQIAGELAGGLLLVEHPPVITVGRLAKSDHLFTPTEALRAAGVEVAETNRGGQMTYHGPGQVVAYPLVNVAATGLSLHGFVHGLEQAVIDTLATFGIVAGRDPKHIGVWVGEEKICAIGLRFRKGWSLHGLALNVEPNLDHFGLFVPCGITDRGVTSIRRILGRPIGIEEVKPILAVNLGHILKCEWKERISVDDLRDRIGISAEREGKDGKRGQKEPNKNSYEDGSGGTGGLGVSPKTSRASVDPTKDPYKTKNGGGDLGPESMAEAVLRAWPELPSAILKETDSLEAEARRRIDEGARPPFLLATDREKAEKGRRGEPWIAPARTSLLFVLALPAMSGPTELVAALAVAEGLEPFSPRKPMLKWPNDVLIDGRKVGAVFAHSTPEDLLLSVAVNVTQTEAELPQPTEGLAATSLVLERRRAESERLEIYSPDHARLRRQDAERGGRPMGKKPAATIAGAAVLLEEGDKTAESRTNLNSSKKPGELAAPRTPSAPSPLDRAAILETVLASLRHNLDLPYDTIRPRLIVRCSTVGRGVRVDFANTEEGKEGEPGPDAGNERGKSLERLEGLAVGIDAEGALLVQITNQRTKQVVSGRLRELPHV